MSETRSGERTHLRAVAVCGLLLAVLAAGLGGWRAAVGTAGGALLGLGNLWALAWVVRGLLAGSRRKAAYVVLGALKFGVLVGLTFLLLRAHLVGLIPLMLGFGALPVGILTAELASRRAVGE